MRLRINFLTTNSKPNSTQSNQRSDFFESIFAQLVTVEGDFCSYRLDIQEITSSNQSDRFWPPFSEDLYFLHILCEGIANGDKHMTKIINKISQADFLVVDNLFVSPLAISAVKQNSSLRLIYISHNIESKLKLVIGHLMHWPVSFISDMIDFCMNYEMQIVKNSAVTFWCSKEDEDYFDFDSDTISIVVPNGGKKRIRSAASKNEILNFLGCRNYVLFVSSGHPPNTYGFIQGVGLDFGFMPPDTRVVIVGSVGAYIDQMIRGTNLEETYLNKASVILDASESLLGDLYAYSSAVILPIFQGSGTSIKAAEAFLNATTIISTEFALRGLGDAILKQTPCFRAENRDQFHALIQEVVSADGVYIEHEEKHAGSWEYLFGIFFNQIRTVFSKDLI